MIFSVNTMNYIENHAEAIFWIGLIAVLCVVGAIAITHHQTTNESFLDNGTVIDKWATEDYVYCLVQIHDDRFKTRYGCEPRIVGDDVEVRMNKNLDTFKITLERIL